MVSLGFKSNTGLRRKKNEDSLFVMPKEEVYVIADGVGGSNSGEVASGVAVTYIAEQIKKKPMDSFRTEKAGIMHIFNCIEGANQKICQMAAKDPKLKGMATTLVLLTFRDNKGYVFNIGDSRAYIYKNKEMMQITEDHSYVNSLVKMGAITEEEAKTHEGGHMITKALGADEKVEPDLFTIDVEKGDVIILCTDGLYDEVSNEKIVSLIEKSEGMSSLAQELVEEANISGGSDNITVVCVKI